MDKQTYVEKLRNTLERIETYPPLAQARILGYVECLADEARRRQEATAKPA